MSDLQKDIERLTQEYSFKEAENDYDWEEEYLKENASREETEEPFEYEENDEFNDGGNIRNRRRKAAFASWDAKGGENGVHKPGIKYGESFPEKSMTPGIKYGDDPFPTKKQNPGVKWGDEPFEEKTWAPNITYGD